MTTENTRFVMISAESRIVIQWPLTSTTRNSALTYGTRSSPIQVARTIIHRRHRGWLTARQLVTCLAATAELSLSWISHSYCFTVFMYAEKNLWAMRGKARTHFGWQYPLVQTLDRQRQPEVYRLNKNKLNQTVSIPNGCTVRIPATATRLISIQSRNR